MNNHKLEAKHPVSNAWLPAASIESFREEHFSFPDPWRPIAVGYPGIEIRLKGVSQPVEDLFEYGMDALRDRVFECLKERYPDKAIEETSDFES